MILELVFVSRASAQEPIKIPDAEIESDFEKVSTASKPDLEALLVKYGDWSAVNPWFGIGMRQSIANRLNELNDRTKAIEVLRPVVSRSLPEEVAAANLFAQSWSGAISQLSDLMFGGEKSLQLFEELKSLQNRPCCYAQKVAYSHALQLQSAAVSGGTIDQQLVQREFSRLQSDLPERPHYMALEQYLNYIRNISSYVPHDKLLEAVDLIRAKEIDAIKTETESDRLFGYFRMLATTNLERATILTRAGGPDISAALSQLADEVDTYADLTLKKMGANGESSYFEARKERFRKDIKRLEDRANLQLNNNLRIIVSDLRGRPSPKFEGESIQNDSITDKSSASIYLLSFCQTSNSSCVMRIPELNALHEKYHADGLRVIGIMPLSPVRWDEKENHLVADTKSTHEQQVHAMAQFAKKSGLKYAQIADDGAIRAAYDVKNYPTYVLIGRNGIVKVVAGDGDETFDAVKQQLQREASKQATATP